MIVSVRFCADNSANNGKIVLTVDFVPPVQPLVTDVGVYWGVTDPNGVAIKPFLGPDPFPGGNADGYISSSPTTSLEVLVDIPIGSDGNYVTGEYAFRLYMKDGELGNDPDAEYEEEIFKNFTFDTVVSNTTTFGEASLQASYNCATAELTADDNTLLDGFTLDERVLRIMSPNVAGYPAPSADTTSAAQLVHTFLWNNADYQVSVSVKRTYTEDLDPETWVFEVNELLTANTTVHITCGTSMCDAAACLASELTALENAACASGSFANVDQADVNELVRKMAKGLIAILYKECGNYNLSAQYAAEAGTCDCGCGGTTATSNQIEPYTP